MTKVSVEIPDEAAADLTRLADRLGTSMEQLAAAGVTDLINRRDEDFSQALARVLAKNAELYKRLA